MANKDVTIKRWNISTWDVVYPKTTIENVTNLSTTLADLSSDITDVENQLNGKEPSFSKNTAFNKNFGSTAGTVTEGNDARLSNARTPLSHTHGNITNDGKIGSVADLVVVTGTSGVLTTQSRTGIDNRTSFPTTSSTHNHDDRYYTETEINNLLNTKIPYNDVLMPTNPFGGKKLYLNHTDNAFFAMDKKATVTVTRHATTYGGNTYPMLNPDYVAIYTTTGSGTTRQITETPYPSNIVVFENDVLKTSPTNYSYNSTTGLITFTVSPSGTIFVYPGAEIVQYLDSPVVEDMSAQAYKLFDASYETNIAVTYGYYLKIRMTYDGTNYSSFDNIFSAYKYGTIYASYYYTGTPLEAYYRVYNYSYRPHTPGWKQTAFSAYTGATTSSGYIGNVSDEGNHGRSIMEVIVVGHDTTNVPENPYRGMNTTQITQLDLKLTRPNLSSTGSTVTKFGTNKLFYDLKLGDRLSDNIVLGADGTITATTFSGNAGTATTLQTARTLTIGSTGKTFNGGADVTWSLAEIGAASSSSLASHESNTSNPHSVTASQVGLGTSSTPTFASVILGAGSETWSIDDATANTLSFKIGGSAKATLTNTGVLTATTFVGALTGTASGNLTSSSSLDASKLSGAISTSVTQSNWDGAVTAITDIINGDVTVGEAGYAGTAYIANNIDSTNTNTGYTGAYSMWIGTQAQYDAIGTKSSTTIYYVI